MNLRRRLEKLQSKCRVTSRGPSIILVCDGGGEARLALLPGLRALSRCHDEAEEKFIDRVERNC